MLEMMQQQSTCPSDCKSFLGLNVQPFPQHKPCQGLPLHVHMHLLVTGWLVGATILVETLQHTHWVAAEPTDSSEQPSIRLHNLPASDWS